MFIEPATAIAVGEELYNRRNELARAFSGLWYFITRGKLRIVVFGAGGSGKTTFGKLMSEKFDQEISSPHYTESRSMESYKNVKGVPLAEVIVPPGQDWRRDIYWQELYEILRESRSVGVVNIVSWGYHAFEDHSYKETQYYRKLREHTNKEISKEQFLSEFLKRGREEDIVIIKELTPRLIDIKKDFWMVTLVTKQDLWWKERVEVHKHYTEGEYHTYITNITNHRRAPRFKHEYLSASLAMNNFTTPSGEIMIPVSEGYDQNIQKTHLRLLFKTIEDFGG